MPIFYVELFCWSKILLDAPACCCDHHPNALYRDLSSTPPVSLKERLHRLATRYVFFSFLFFFFLFHPLLVVIHCLLLSFCVVTVPHPLLQWTSLLCLRTGWYLTFRNTTVWEELFFTNIQDIAVGSKEQIWAISAVMTYIACLTSTSYFQDLRQGQFIGSPLRLLQNTSG